MEDITAGIIAEATGGKILRGREDRPATGCSIDSRDTQEGDVFFALRGTTTDGHKYIDKAYQKGARIFVISDESVVGDAGGEKYGDASFILVGDSLKALQDLAHSYIAPFTLFTIAVTGSVGKTTTRDMIYSIVRRKYKTGTSRANRNSETGLPLTLLTFTRDMKMAVVEMAMDAPGQISDLVKIIKPDMAVITNIGISHLERLGTRDNIFKAKMEITEGMTEKNTLIINGDDDKLQTIQKMEVPYRVITAGTRPGVDFRVSEIEDLGAQGVRFHLTYNGGTRPIRLAMPGAHNALNAALAAAAASAIGIPVEDIVAGLAQAETTGNRLKISTTGGIQLIDDTYNAAPESVESAIRTLMKCEGKRKIAILGAMNELGDMSETSHRAIGRFAVEAGVDLLITIGDKGKQIAEGAADLPSSTHLLSFTKKEELYPEICAIFREGDTILVKASHSLAFETLSERIRESFVGEGKE